jgi:hypothetical protein
MPLSSPRADNLAFIRDLLVLIYRGNITDQTSFDTYLSENKNWKKSRRYHYLSGLRDLHFIRKENDTIKLEEAGEKSSQLGISNFGGLDWIKSILNEEEKDLIKHHLLHYPPFMEFLSLFLETDELLNKYSTFYKDAKAIGLVFDKGEYNRRITETGRPISLSGWKVIRPNGISKSLSKSEKHAIMWTLKYWAKTLDLIDELWIPQFKEYLGRFQKALFPIKVKEKEISLDRFQRELDSLIDKRDYHSSYIPIPILIYDFCTTYFVPVKLFLNLLCRLHFKLPGDYYLDKVSRAYIDERYHWIGKRQIPGEQKYQRTYTNYPRIDDFYSSHLVIRK